MPAPEPPVDASPRDAPESPQLGLRPRDRESTLQVLMERLRVRLRAERLGGPIWWCWDLGYFVEMRRRPTDASA